LYFEPHVGSLSALLHASTSVCVIAGSAEQTLEPADGQLPPAAVLAADELLQAAAPTNKTAPKNITRFFIWLRPPVEKRMDGRQNVTFKAVLKKEARQSAQGKTPRQIYGAQPKISPHDDGSTEGARDFRFF
jgi:hypothetical protein